MVDSRDTADPAGDDALERERALDITRSFLVQAPAGSGKTELLIQRYLALLAQVDRPERIAAMTFTRKAAGEMRERIVTALREAEAATPTRSAHARRTRGLAEAALAQDRRHGWRVSAHPARLRVSTIDALAAALARQAPLTAGLGATPRYDERPAPLYAKAARAALASARAEDPAWRRLLAHLDNDAHATVGLVADMLAKRDQWQRELDVANRGAFRARLEATLAAEIEGEIAVVAALFPARLAAELADHERYAATNLTQSVETSERARDLDACATGGGLPQATVAALRHWRALAEWLLVAKHPRFRMAVSAKVGFPPKGTGVAAPIRRERNTAMMRFLEQLAAVPGLADTLHGVRRLPPAHYAEDVWAIVDALLDVLPQAVAQLAAAFREAGAIDFTQGTLGALDALGRDDAPSDLLLRLDLQLQHLLIDEFQDTSFTQLDLIGRLTAGWQPDDGRTVFAVGDPMQSVYRFRGAEVRLFVEAQQSGAIGALPVESLVLNRNFRSQRGLVEWVNAVFPHVLGATSDPWRGTVGFASSSAVGGALAVPAATVDVAVDAEREAAIVIDHVRAAQREGCNGIAVLVRARSHLDVLLPAFRAAGISFAAVELDALAERQAVQDLLSLTRALIQPADRLAWLAVLRAPWCGLVLADLVAVVAAADARPDRSIAALLDTIASITGLTAEGHARFARVAAALVRTLAARGRSALAARVRGAWLALGGPATVEEAIDLEAAERYFALLAEHDEGDDVADWAAFVEALAQLHAEAAAADDAAVQAMTLHRAKGLEFDTVIMPGLGRAPHRGNAEILRWRRRPTGLLVAPMKARGGTDDPVYAYLGRLADSEEAAELGRLLYVGCTRAKRRLHLTAALTARAKDGASLTWKSPPAGSALATFWDAVGHTVAAPLAANQEAPPAAQRRLVRLPLAWAPSLPGPGVPVVAATVPIDDTVPFEWARETAKRSGTVAHRLFAQIAREGLSEWSAERVTNLSGRIRTELAGEGVDEAELDAASANVAAMITRLLADERGRWLFDHGHADARSEWALAGAEGDAIAHVVLDRSFVTDGVRWIVDFKTGAHEGGDVAAFLDAEVDRYRSQLDGYARFVRALDARPIRLAIYFPLLAGWREWSYDG